MPLTGTWEYTAGRHLHDSTKVKIEEGGWMCEAALWIEWLHRGHLTIVKQSDLAIISSVDLQKSARHHASSLPLLKQYAFLFAKTIIKDAKQDRVDDLWGTKYGLRPKMFESDESLREALDTVDMSELKGNEVR
mmetsp:Transcript_140828/g.248778  ORF Transcript_140828/g.248778 Transcript_140828/m.248778 type:complete len:134 (-) Transcript_140828:66-467(-)